MSFKQFHLISLFTQLTAKQAVVAGCLGVLGDRSTRASPTTLGGTGDNQVTPAPNA